MEQDLRVIDENVPMKERDEEGNLSDWTKNMPIVVRRKGDDDFTSFVNVFDKRGRIYGRQG